MINGIHLKVVISKLSSSLQPVPLLGFCDHIQRTERMRPELLTFLTAQGRWGEAHRYHKQAQFPPSLCYSQKSPLLGNRQSLNSFRKSMLSCVLVTTKALVHLHSIFEAILQHLPLNRLAIYSLVWYLPRINCMFVCQNPSPEFHWALWNTENITWIQ